MGGSHLFSIGESIDSLRGLGLTTIDAVNELIDNSFDADSDIVQIHIIKDDAGVSIIIEDNGHGIPGDKLDKVLTFGGRLNDKRPLTTGRFGWGLPSAVCCQTTRAEVFSKFDGRWSFSYIDLIELKSMEDPLIPEAIMREPPAHLPLELREAISGTVVYLENCDRLDYKTIDRLEQHISDRVGEIHRKYLSGGKRIFVNGARVQVADPLMLTVGCKHSDKVGIATDFADIKPIIIDKNIIDPITGKPAEINIKLALMNLEEIRKSSDYIALARQVGFNVDNQGFYLMRHNRQIGRALSLDLYSKHNDFNYFRGEIAFPPVLDGYFGVQTNKSRYSIDSNIRDLIKERIATYLVQIRNLSKQFQQKAETRENAGEISRSEAVAADVDKRLKKSKFEATPQQLRKEQEDLNNQKDEEIRQVNQDPELTPEQKQAKIRRIENKFRLFRPFIRSFEFIESGNFYLPRPKGKSTEVVINTAHPFYMKVYEKAAENNSDVFLDLLLFALVKGELEYYASDDMRKFYAQQRNEWSQILQAYLDEFSDKEPDG